MLLPMIEALRNAHPHARIECAVQVPMGSLLRLVPSLDHVYEFSGNSRPTTNPWLELRTTVTVLRRFWQTLRHVHPTTCIVPRWGSGFRDLLVAYLTQAPTRIGFAANDFDRSQPPGGYRDALLTRHVRGAQRMREPTRFLFLLEQAGVLPPMDRTMIEVQPNPSMRHIADTVEWPALAVRFGVDPQAPLVVIAPGASAARRMWPIDRWATVIAELHSYGYTVALLAGPSDAIFARQLYNSIPLDRRAQTTLVAGVSTLPESTCLIAHSRLFIGNDSGPGHIAGALGVPCLILFIAAEGADPDGPSAPERVRPLGEHIVCCRPAKAIPPCVEYCTADTAHCILEIQAADALRALRSLLQ